jgi:cytochrome c biogenesis protein CcdA
MDFGGSPWLRTVAAILILLVGLVLIFPALAHRMEAALAPLQRLGAALQTRLPSSGLLGQAAAGALLALVWAPCAGPTLAAAFVLAARGGSLPFAILSMSIYALGAAGALLALGYGFGRLAGGGRRAALATGAGARLVLGGAFALVGVSILTGADHGLEAFFTAHMPDALARFAASL